MILLMRSLACWRWEGSHCGLYAFSLGFFGAKMGFLRLREWSLCLVQKDRWIFVRNSCFHREWGIGFLYHRTREQLYRCGRDSNGEIILFHRIVFECLGWFSLSLFIRRTCIRVWECRRWFGGRFLACFGRWFPVCLCMGWSPLIWM